MTPKSHHSSSATPTPPHLADPAVRRAPRRTVRYGGNPAYGSNPVLGVGGAYDVGYGYGGRLGHGEAELHPHSVHHDAPFREPWPQEVYERHQQEQRDAAARLAAAAYAAIQLSTAVRERLDGHEGIDADQILVVTDGGEVTLYGEVADQETRRLAADLIEPLWGVTCVHNLLRLPVRA